jgi:predicted naringenin-chalcone synthase
MANIISAAIFGDGASCVLLSSEAGQTGPKILGEGMYHFPDSTHLMGFDLKNTGLKMVLDPAVPATIATHFEPMLLPFLGSFGKGIEDLDCLIFHPGGRKIVQTVESLFEGQAADLADTREVLRLFGNMSSVTVLYVLQRFLEKGIPKGKLGLMLSFGPGFTAQRVLLEF